jgi:hypothetical protein
VDLIANTAVYAVKRPYIRVALLGVLCALGLKVHANDGKPAMKVAVSIESDVPQVLHAQLQDLLGTAISFVEAFPPPESKDHSFFHWNRDRKILQGKDFLIAFSSSKNPLFAPIVRGTTKMDAFTMTPMNVDKKQMKIMLVLLVDRIFYDQQGRERPDGLARLILALAHEIYANVHHFLSYDISKATEMTQQYRIEMERKAFHTSLSFLMSLNSNPKFMTMPESLRKKILDLIPQETRAYDHWLNQKGHNIVDQTCAEMMNAINGLKEKKD